MKLFGAGPMLLLFATTCSYCASPLHTNWLNTSISPAQDFYTYANGNWQKNHPIPPEYASWSPFNQLQQKVLNRLHSLLLTAAADKQAKPGSITQKVGDFYYSGMNEKDINANGIKPLIPIFKRIQAIQNLQDLQDIITHLQLLDTGALFEFGSMQDFKNSKMMIGAAGQGGLSLPDKEYYLKEDKQFSKLRTAFVNHVSNMFLLAGEPKDKAAVYANKILSIETALAKASMSKIEQRDPRAIYHIMNNEALRTLTPHWQWPRYFRALGLSELEQINMAMPEFFRKMDLLLVQVPIEDWKVYLQWHLLDTYAPYLSEPFVLQNFKMQQLLTGAKSLLPRWQRVIEAENDVLGFALGELYVKRYFSEEAKQQVLQIVHDIRQTLQASIQNVQFMAPTTRKAALQKLALIEQRVGYPTQWRDYSELTIDKGPYVLNVMRGYTFLVKRDLHKINKPVDREEWAMTPQTINAYYDPSMNSINLPAGILQPPFFDPKAPAAVNYGAIGFVIGHEITHGFDDQGAKFDAYGNLNDWWTPEDLKKFETATACIAQQFSQYKVNGNLSVQGNLVVGEAAADLGGVTLAYKAYINSQSYKKAQTIEGFTPKQQFFLGAAHVWANNMRPEQARNQVMTDPHPPAKYRVNGTFANMPDFSLAFVIQPLSPMVNPHPCKLW